MPAEVSDDGGTESSLNQGVFLFGDVAESKLTDRPARIGRALPLWQQAVMVCSCSTSPKFFHRQRGHRSVQKIAEALTEFTFGHTGHGVYVGRY